MKGNNSKFDMMDGRMEDTEGTLFKLRDTKEG